MIILGLRVTHQPARPTLSNAENMRTEDPAQNPFFSQFDDLPNGASLLVQQGPKRDSGLNCHTVLNSVGSLEPTRPIPDPQASRNIRIGSREAGGCGLACAAANSDVACVREPLSRAVSAPVGTAPWHSVLGTDVCAR